MAILLAGGAGYIGTHTAVEFLNAGYDVVIADNLYNSKAEAVRRVEKITGKAVSFYQIDVCDKAALQKLFSEQKIDTVVHFAGMKAVGESVAKPLMYYRNNLDATLTLLEVMKEFGCRNVIYNAHKLFLADRRDELLSAGLWGMRLLFTTESARECVEVAKAYLGMTDYQPNMLTRGLYYRGVE